jgi:myosin heavy subunit
MDRLTDALRIAGQNAANARCDADAAESYASSLAAQLESLRSVVDETKRVSETLYLEHELVSQAARLIEGKLLQRETEFARAQKEQKQLLEEQGILVRKIKTGKDNNRRLELELDSFKEELNHAKREVQERESVDKARKDRSAMVEKELREARAMLADAASTAAETEATSSVLKDTIRGLQTETTSLHDRMCEIQEKTQKEQERLHDSLGKAEREAQSLRVNAASHDDDMQRLRSDMNSCDKQTTQLKTRIANLERRLKDATSLIPLSSHDTLSSSTKTPDNRKSFTIPPLTPARDMPVASISPKSSLCSICSKAASGMMKSCQCGQRGCDKRAHSACVARSYSPSLSSLSHPGSPAPSALLLCARISM